MSKYITKVCPHCQKEFQVKTFPSTIGQIYCSLSCRNKAITNKGKTKKSKTPSRAIFFDATCLNCAKYFQYTKASRPRKFCSNKCVHEYKANVGIFAKGREELNAYICEQYPSANLDELMKETGLSLSAIFGIAHRNGIHRSDEAMQAMYATFSERMSKDNPMKNPETVAKVDAWWKERPELRIQSGVKSAQAQGIKKTSKLEIRCAEYLTTMGLDYEHQAIIKDKFVVDFRIGNTILQCDGDYWHGHKSFEPLTERQLKQQKRDAAQDKYLQACGYSVIRVWESDMSLEYLRNVLK
jgi:G:T-mismatch repair DNA endonuclease (very short patch repair protein)/endogenous inhibitor of DNA gyrase (YacG/DUF329 family)